jgi:hypothetical protein
VVDLEHGHTGESGEAVGPGVETSAEDDDLLDRRPGLADDIVDQACAGHRRWARPRPADEIEQPWSQRPDQPQA